MGTFKHIQEKLEQFIRKYYINELLKGCILFFAIGLLYFMLTLLVEYFLWLDQTGRSILFWLFVLVEAGLFSRFIAIPLAKLFKLRKGIDYLQASKIIGNHFPDVSDKLLNLLQLSGDSHESELLLASIEQKAQGLRPVPFKLAVNFNANRKYLKYAAIPVLIFLLFLATGNTTVFSESYTRVVNYKMAYEPPAPFQFIIENESLSAIEKTDYTLKVKTVGELVPDNVSVHFNEQTYFLQKTGVNTFQYVFSQPDDIVGFYLSGNDVRSKPYELSVVKTPNVIAFEMQLDYPAYTKKRDEIIKNTGNATVPEGTTIRWNLKTKQTTSVNYNLRDTTLLFKQAEDNFNLSKRVFNNYDYEISTSNKELKDYERLGFSIAVIKDAYPEMNLQSKKDSVDLRTLYFLGQVSDDYGLSKLRLVYYPLGEEQNPSYSALPLQGGTFDEFAVIFPGELPLTEGTNYEFYFEVRDNDAIRGGKSTKSQVFNYRKLTADELQKEQLQQQNETIKDLNKSLEKMEENEKELRELSKTQKEKPQLSFNDKKKLENFLKRQRQQEQIMKDFNQQLKENLEDFQNENSEKDEFKEALKDRLETNEAELKKNEKLLEELEKLAEKIKKEELSMKLEELAKQQKNDKRSLEQILELTKRYYVAKKAEKLQKELSDLAKKQEAQYKKDLEENKKEEQDKLNEDFKDLQKEMEELQKENQGLKKPMKLERDKKTEEDIKKDQQEASDNLEKKEKSDSQQEKQQQQENAKKNQKKAARKMKKMSQQMESSMMSGGGEQMQEDAEMLRQILDNLVVFSFEQEALLENFKEIDNRNANFGANLRRQNELRSIFEHVDDSLFALSLRQPMISETVNKEVIDVYFNIDKALERLSENRMYQGVSSQQYALTAANNLADFLSKILDNMQAQMMMSAGKGGGKPQPGIQLPDIIKSQQQLNEMMKGQMKKDGEGEPKDGKPKKGEGEGKEGEDGKPQEGTGKKPDTGEGQQQGQLNGGQGEMDSQQLYEIYKRQARLREKLEQMLREADEQLKDKKGAGNKADDQILRQMEQIEQELLEKGMTERTLQRMTQLEHQLLKLENAAFQQGKKNKRESETNQQQYNNPTDNQIPTIKQYFNSTEILNRHVLPLRQIYKRKVQTYFKKTDD